MFEEIYVALRYGRILIKGGGMHELEERGARLATWISERRKVMAIGARGLGGRRQWRHQRVGKDELYAN
jgi:hypothetical protein